MSRRGSSKLTRRSFVKLLAFAASSLTLSATGASYALGAIPRSLRPAPTKEPGKYVAVVDLSKCNGCGKCTEGCIAYHDLPIGMEWIKIFKIKDAAGEYSLPRLCMQCQGNTPCVNVCPVGAAFMREDGVVLIDSQRCIGCRFCMAACPYSARFFNWQEPDHSPITFQHEYSPEEPWPQSRGTTAKCDFCTEKLSVGQLPACASSCPTGALYFGDQYEDTVTNGRETVSFKSLIKQKGGYRILEELGTEPNVWYLPPRRE